MKEIKFRGKRLHTKEWVYGHYNKSLHPADYEGIITKDRINLTGLDNYFVIPETVGQFTGITDKNGKEIYEGDILQHYAFRRYTQQSHHDVRPEIDELVIGGPFIDKVVFTHGCFTLSKEFNEEDFPFISPLSQFGFYSVERVKEDIFEDMDLDEEDKETDCNGTKINESIIGIEIIGNIHDNPALLKS